MRYASLAALLAILVGAVAVFARIARLGFITDFLSKPVLVGYIFGATLIVIGIAAFRFLRQVRPAEFWLAVVTALGVLTVGVL